MKYKILLSSYSCEPNKGSESEVGWSWAINLVKKGHTVYVITRANQRKSIENYINNKKIKNLHFIYFDLSKILLSILKPNFSKNSYLYYLLWQLGIFFKAHSYVKKIKFDFIHHVTYVSYRFPSFLIFYDIPFILGPLSGGDTVPLKLRKKFGFFGSVKEFIRDLSNLYIKFSPLMNLVFYKSKKIYVNSNETKNYIPKIFHKKISNLLAIGIEVNNNIRPRRIKKKQTLKLCFAGNLINIKGIRILMNTFLKLSKVISCQLYIYGDGKLKQYIYNFSEEHNIEKLIYLRKKVNRKFFLKSLIKNHVLLMPALRDSGSYVTLEAMSKGIPCAVLDIGGPNILVTNNSGIKIKSNQKNQELIVKNLTKSLIKLYLNPIAYYQMSSKSILRARKFTWKEKIRRVYS